MEGQVLRTGAALLAVHGLHDQELGFDPLQIGSSGAHRRQRACLDLQTTADLQHLEKSVPPAVDRERKMHGLR